MTDVQELVCANCGSDRGCDPSIPHVTRLVRKSRVHELKTSARFFEDVREGQKNFEVRRADRPFEVGDTLLFREIDALKQYTGRYCYRRITYVLSEEDGREFGVCAGYCVLGLR